MTAGSLQLTALPISDCRFALTIDGQERNPQSEQAQAQAADGLSVLDCRLSIGGWAGL